MDRRTLADTVATRLAGVTNTTGYFGQIGRPLPGLEATTPKDPPAKSVQDPRVAPYFIYYPPAPGTHPDATLCGTGTPLVGGHVVTAVAGDVEDLAALVDRIDTLLHQWHIDMGSMLTRRPGYEAPQLIDNTHTPNRLYMRLEYLATTT